MKSFLGWVDGDPAHEAAVLRALGAWRSQDARDELGLGGVRDTFADAFFPGLSTIHTRLRYFLFIQWCCELAAHHTSEDEILADLHRREIQLIETLTAMGPRQGVIGIEKQADLERLPSEIYWTGLRSLGLRTRAGSRAQWARRVVQDRIGARDTPLGEGQSAAISTGFASDRPAMPPGFPLNKGLDFTVTKTEARFLGRRLADACVDPAVARHNLIKPFQQHRRRLGQIALWYHPEVARLEVQTRDVVRLAQAFSNLMHGAVLLYQKAVAELVVRDGGSAHLLDMPTDQFSAWCRTRLAPADVDLVAEHIMEIIPLAQLTRHGIGGETLSFVREWAKRCSAGEGLLHDAAAVTLVSRRERFLKGAIGTSRIASPKARARWKGGTPHQLDYRWDVARTYLNDLASAV